jgi:hypothetical protein
VGDVKGVLWLVLGTFFAIVGNGIGGAAGEGEGVFGGIIGMGQLVGDGMGFVDSCVSPLK